jgi:UDP-N-acetylmuramate-alanine ligase
MRELLKPNDVFVTLGAGDVNEISEALVRGSV